MSNLQSTIKDLIFFYVKTNYEKYLKDNNICKNRLILEIRMHQNKTSNIDFGL